MKLIIEADYGLASSYDDLIEINKKLKGNLRKKILAHELRHENNNYSFKDFKNDFQAKDSHFTEAFKFALKNKEALIGYFPFMYSYYLRKFTYNSSALFPFIWFGAIWIIFWWVLFRINVLNSALGYVIFYTVINIVLLIYTHCYVCKHARK